MAVEDRAHGVGDRLVHVVAVDEHGVEAGDRAARRGAGALEQLRQQREHARRVAARGGRLADRQADLALGHREARDRVHHQHHVAALVAEVLGDRGRGEGGLDAHERGLVGRRDDHDRAGHALGAEVALDELAHLAAALADEADHVDVGRRRAGDHAQQRRLADAGAGEDAEALAAAAGDERVERAHAERDALGDARARRAGPAAAPRPARARPPPTGPRPSSGRPRPSSARPSRSSETSTRSGWPLALTRAPGPMPVASPSAISSVRPARKPTTSAGTAGGRGRSRSCRPRRPRPRGRWPRRSGRSGR